MRETVPFIEGSVCSDFDVPGFDWRVWKEGWIKNGIGFYRCKF